MNELRFSAHGWLLVYFVVLAPLHYATNGTLIWGLINASVGIFMAIVILGFNKPKVKRYKTQVYAE